jgi:hypothetical protein
MTANSQAVDHATNILHMLGRDFSFFKESSIPFLNVFIVFKSYLKMPLQLSLDIIRAGVENQTDFSSLKNINRFVILKKNKPDTTTLQHVQVNILYNPFSNLIECTIKISLITYKFNRIF